MAEQTEIPPSVPNDTTILNMKYHCERYIFESGHAQREIPSFLPRVKTVLDMKCGGLGKLPFKAFCHISHLKVLRLSLHELAFVDSGAFLCLDNLTDLTLSFCQITNLLNGTFSMLHHLVHLNPAGR